MSDEWVFVPKTAVPIEWRTFIPPIPRPVWDAMVERAAKEFSGAPFPSPRTLRKANAALRAALGNPEIAP